MKEEKAEKAVLTTVTDPETVRAMHEILERLRAVGWPDGKHGLKIPLPNGGEVEVTGQAGRYEALKVVLVRKP